jgi:hypothetical protein
MDCRVCAQLPASDSLTPRLDCLFVPSTHGETNDVAIISQAKASPSALFLCFFFLSKLCLKEKAALFVGKAESQRERTFGSSELINNKVLGVEWKGSRVPTFIYLVGIGQ